MSNGKHVFVEVPFLPENENAEIILERIVEGEPSPVFDKIWHREFKDRKLPLFGGETLKHTLRFSAARLLSQLRGEKVEYNVLTD